MSGIGCAIAGAVCVSVGWLFALLWALEQRDAAERNAQRWKETCYRLEIITGGRKGKS